MRQCVRQIISSWSRRLTQGTVGWTAFCSPSPRPSPLGRGRIVRRRSSKHATAFAKPVRAGHTPDRGYSLSMNRINSDSTRPSKAAEHRRTPRRWRAVPRVGPGEAFGVRWQAERHTALGCGRGTGCADEKAPPLRRLGFPRQVHGRNVCAKRKDENLPLSPEAFDLQPHLKI